MRLLVAAYACRPNVGSEPGIAWNLLIRLARHHELVVITRARYREVVDTHLADHPLPSVTFVYHDVSILTRLKHMPGGFFVYHYAWHLSLSRLAASLHQKQAFDAAHHLTFGSFRYPSGLRNLGIPLIIGPVGGAEDSPPELWFSLGPRGFVNEAFRWLSNRIATFDPLVRSTYRSAARVLAVTETTRLRLARIPGARLAEILPQCGVDPDAHETSSPAKRDSRQVRVLFVGRLVPWKGVHLALEAMARTQVHLPGMEFTIVGEGVAEDSLRRLISRRALPNVYFQGQLRQQEVFDRYAESDIFLFPSLHDSGGMAVLEAMASGLPVVCLNLGGPALAVTKDCGIVVNVDSRTQVIDDLATALLRLARNPELRLRMGIAGRKRILDYSWDTKVTALDGIYQALQSHKR